MIEQEHVTDLLAGYALGILTAEEILLAEAHLEQCADCRRELVELRQVVSALPDAVGLHDPSPALRARILEAASARPRAAEDGIKSDQFVLPSVVEDRPRQPKTAKTSLWERLFSPGPAWAVASLVIVAALFLSNLFMWMQVRRLQSAAPLRSIALMGTEAAGEAAGTLVISRDGEYGVLVADHLPALDPDQQYQLWLIQDGKRVSGGVFSVNPEGYGALLVTSPQPLESYQSVGVTVEPYGGSPGPTGQKVLGGDL